MKDILICKIPLADIPHKVDVHTFSAHITWYTLKSVGLVVWQKSFFDLSVGCCHDGKGNLETNTDFGRDFEELFRFHWERIDSDYSRWSTNWLSDFNDWSGFLSFGELPNDGGEDPNEYLWEYHSITEQLIANGTSVEEAYDHDYEYKWGPYPKGNVKPMKQIYINEDPVYEKWEQCETGNLATCHQGPPPGIAILMPV